MSTPSKDERFEMELAIFDSFSKTVMRNSCRNIVTAARKREYKEFIGTEEIQHMLKVQWQEDMYPSEHIISDKYGYTCIITTKWLYQAMLQLPEKQKEVLILEFWYGMMMFEIADELHISVRSVYNRKQKAFQYIRKYYERNL